MTSVAEDVLEEEGAIPPTGFHGAVARTVEVADYPLEVPENLEEQLDAVESRILVARETLEDAAFALISGNLVLQGPPGTGKSSLARELCRVFGVTPLAVTAHQDWSSYDLIGRKELRLSDDGREEVVPVDGVFTKAALDCAGIVSRHFDEPDLPQAVWLLIDELNRANVDEAFGELFSVLGADEVVPITLLHRGNDAVLYTSKRFRIVATLNSFDKQFVNALSQGVRRRFSFVTIGIPDQRPEGEDWGEGDSIAAREYGIVVREAIARTVRSGGAAMMGEPASSLEDLCAGRVKPSIDALFELAESLRYAGADENDTVCASRDRASY